MPLFSSSETLISERVARGILFVERYLLPWLYLWLIYDQISTIHTNYVEYRAASHAGLHTISWPLFCATVTKYALLAVLTTFVGIALLFSRRPTHPPTRLSHITLPLAMSYYPFLYGAVKWMPEDWQASMMPVQWQVSASIAAVVLSTVGYIIGLWGLWNLGRSFAIMVAVRRVETGGPYRYVRHPMYLGYLFELVGLLLSSLTPAMILLGAGFVMLMVTRARLEEEKLAEADPTYRDYMQRTGFLFPRFGRRQAIRLERSE